MIVPSSRCEVLGTIERTWLDVIRGLAPTINATTPATWGEAIDVPLRKP